METTRRYMWPVLVVLFGSALIAFSLNQFLIPHQLLSGGVSGVSMIIGYVTDWNIGIIYFALNVPLIVWGWMLLGRRFIFLSMLSVVAVSWLMLLIPEQAVTANPLLSAVFGGVLHGIGTAVCFRAGASSGGLDIVGSIITRKRDFPVGQIMFIINSLIVLTLGYLENWDVALSSMLSIYVNGKMIDLIHVRHLKITAFIITTKKEALVEKLLKFPRGVTVIQTEGAYTHTPREMLMTVTTRYELAELKKIIRETDPKAFVNIVPTSEVIGEFRRN